MTRAASDEPLKVLFVCHFNRHRSATAERMFCKRPDLDVRSAGTSTEAMVRINERMLAWADVVFIMDEGQRTAMREAFPGHRSLDRCVCLDIPDDYTFLHPTLVALLRERVEPHLDRVRQHRTKA